MAEGGSHQTHKSNQNIHFSISLLLSLPFFNVCLRCFAPFSRCVLSFHSLFPLLFCLISLPLVISSCPFFFCFLSYCPLSFSFSFSFSVFFSPIPISSHFTSSSFLSYGVIPFSFPLIYLLFSFPVFFFVSIFPSLILSSFLFLFGFFSPHLISLSLIFFLSSGLL